MHQGFERLYAELGVSPDDDLARVRLAYRRRLSALHPDKNTGTTVAGGLSFQELKTLYAQALEVHRVHGHLPGARPQLVTPVPVAASPRRQHPVRQPSRDKPAARSRWGVAWVGLCFVTACVAVFALTHRAEQASEAAGVASPGALDAPVPADASTATVGVSPNVVAGGAAAIPARLALGMHKEMVASIQGAPVEQGDATWYYGPSWLQFEDDRLVAWYSSPLRPLQTPTRASPR